MPYKIDGTGFRERLIATLVGLVVLISLGMGALLTLYLFEEEQTRAVADLDVAERLTRNVIARRTVLELARLLKIRSFYPDHTAGCGSPPGLRAGPPGTRQRPCKGGRGTGRPPAGTHAPPSLINSRAHPFTRARSNPA